MADFSGFDFGIIGDAFITPNLILELMQMSDFIHFTRSGVNLVPGSCADLIEQACAGAVRKKVIRGVLPNILNGDIVVRAREAGRSPDEVRANLSQWQETLAQLAETLAPHHILELRTTMEPHRYHSIFSEKGAILGIPWHAKASLATSSFLIGRAASNVISNLHEDFESFYAKCKPYALGDNERIRNAPPARDIDDEVLLSFGKNLPWYLEALRYIARSFPLADKSGVTKAHLRVKFDLDESTCNKRLLEMEYAGLLRRAGDHASNEPRHGRVATGYGKMVVEKYRNVVNGLSQ